MIPLIRKTVCVTSLFMAVAFLFLAGHLAHV